MPAPNPINPLIDPITTLPIGQTCGPESVNLNSPFPTAISWTWDFGDGQTSIIQNPSNFYSVAGKYDLQHTATFSDGSVKTMTILGFIDQYILDANFSLIKNEFCNNNSYIYSTGAEVQYADRKERDRLLEQAQREDYGIRGMIHAVVQSQMFRNK